MANNDVLVRMKADTQNYDANIAKARRSLESFKQDNLTLGGILNQTTRSLTAAAAGFASIAAVAGTIKDVVNESVQLAKAGEGIRLAFDRLNRPDLLDGLRKATHSTVTDIELMKAAVKFNDFKLPVDELGTMLAYAQQKAKDTGQSIDYMVESLVTGLGRKSLMILDNLGLSATEIRDKMKETGDMTKAVGEIIREQMAAAGDYVETAADRAAQANASLQNKMEELGRKFGPLEQASSNLWTSIKIGILDIVGGPLTEFINKLTEAGRLAQKYSVLGGSGKVGRMINNLSGAREGNRQSVYQQQQEQFWRYINPREQQIRDIQAWQRGERGEALQKRVSAITDKYGSLDATKIQAEVDAAKKMLAEYVAGAKGILNPASSTPAPVVVTNATGGSSGASGNTFNASVAAFTGGQGFKAEDTMPSVWAMMGGDQGLRKMMGIGKQQTDIGRVLKEYVNGNESEEEQEKTSEEQLQGIQTMIGSLQSIAGGLDQLGIELPQELTNIFGVLQTITGIVGAIQSMQTVGTFLGIFHNGGMVPHAANGYYVPGGHYSNDVTPVLANAGELILNRAAQGNIASQLQGGMGAMQLSAIITGEQLRLILNNNGRRTGRGEYVTTNFR